MLTVFLQRLYSVGISYWLLNLYYNGIMLVFLDESGDTGRKVNSGSSLYFLVGLVLFGDDDEALACDNRISLLRKEIGRPNDFEFHFSDNSRSVRMAFLSAIQQYDFRFVVVAIDKSSARLDSHILRDKTSFYQRACYMVVNDAWPNLECAKFIIDKNGSSTFQGELRRYLRSQMNDRNRNKIKKFKAQDSRANNLLQLADYCVGVYGRRVQNKKDWQEYHKYISKKELSFKIWPK